jgi:2-C-methyl-D-erythritol 4-phosphate cytidylyltransferase
VEWVLIHDAARPLVSRTLILSVLERLHAGDVDAVIPAIPVSDTVKKVSGDRIISTLDRSSLVTVQTPQGFRRDVLVEAHRVDPHEDVTDDAGLVERLGGTVVTVPGETTNLKVTYPEDLERARALAAAADSRG